MRALVTTVLGLLLSSVSCAQSPLQRVPADVNFNQLFNPASKSCDHCIAILSTAAPHSCPVAIVSSGENSDPARSYIQAVFYSKPDQPAARPVPHDQVTLTLPTSDLMDSDNAAVKTGDLLMKIMQQPALSDDATVIVPGGSLVDTSLLIQRDKAERFVIEQKSPDDRFVRNLSKLRTRMPSRDLAVFDFSPRTSDAIRAMQAEGSDRVWRKFSGQIVESFRAAGGSKALKPRSLEALVQRLKHPDGGVVVIYGHSDGTKIWLDTDIGVRSLSIDDVRRIGLEAGGNLPPVVLLNCSAEPLLAPAFLDAGAPLVVATDKSLGVDQAAGFLDRLARAIFVEKADVLDAYYVAQRDTAPYRLRPMAAVKRAPWAAILARNVN